MERDIAMKNNIYIICLDDIDWSIDGFEKYYTSPFSTEDSSDVNFFINFYKTYIEPNYSECVLYECQNWDEDDYNTYIPLAINKLYGWYKAHIDAMNDIKSWYESNRENLLSNQLTVISKTKTSDTPQDGTDYTDDYPTTQVNVESGTQVKDNVAFLSALAKKYHNYMTDFATLFIKELGIYFDVDRWDDHFNIGE